MSRDGYSTPDWNIGLVAQPETPTASHELSAEKPVCLFCGKLADHKCGDDNDCGGCCAVRGGLAATDKTAYKWIEDVVRPRIAALQSRLEAAEQQIEVLRHNARLK